MDQAKRKHIIKNAIILFLVILLLLTFFSNTILNWSLAEVEIKAVKSDSITTQIRESGVAKALSTYQVMLPGSREIAGVHVALGDEVQPGDLLFTLTETEDDMVKTAEEELSQLRLDYQTGLLGDALPSYAADNAEVQALNRAYNQAVTERNALGNTSKTLTQVQTQVDNAQTEVDQWTAIRDKIEGQLTQIENGDSTYAGIRNEVLLLQEAGSELAQEQGIYDKAVLDNGGQTHQEVDTAILVLENEVAGMTEGTPKQQAQARLALLREQYTILNKAYESLAAAKDKVSNMTVKLNAKKASERQARLKEYDEAQTQLEKTEKTLLDANTEYNSVKRIKDAQAAVESAQNALNAKVLSLQAQQSTDETEQKKTTLTLQNLALKIEEKEVELVELRKTLVGREVRAAAGGIISSINAEVGATAAEKEILAEIEMVDAGLAVTISVDANLAENITIDMPVQVYTQSGGMYGIEAAVSAVRVNMEEQNSQKLIDIQIDGDVQIGQTLTVTIPLSSQAYDAVVPKSAVNSDESGDYVFTVGTKQTPMGTRYYAEKVSVQVLAQDGVQAALEGGPSPGEYVITAATGIVNPGDYVRMSESTEGPI